MLALDTLTLPKHPFIIYPKSCADYTKTHDDMLARILTRIEQKKQGILSKDELWLVEHQDVYTLGQAGKEEHILTRTNTPILKTDRGGQVTWHGQGQLVVYFLFDLIALGWGVRDLVSHTEQALEDVLNSYLPQELIARARRDAPGVYIYNHDGDMLGKIASLGFKIKHGHSYHGLALNLTCDLSPFLTINPCGYAGMRMVRLGDFVPTLNTNDIITALVENIAKRHAHQLSLRPLDP